MRTLFAIAVVVSGCSLAVDVRRDDSIAYPDIESDPRCARIDAFTHSELRKYAGACDEVHLRLYECAQDGRLSRLPVVDEIPVSCKASEPK